MLLEKHADFLRDFRGDTVHPSTMDLLDELGLGEQTRASCPHRDARHLAVTFADGTFTLADFGRLQVAHPVHPVHAAVAPAEPAGRRRANALDTFTLLRSHEVTDVTRDRGIVTGVRARGPQGDVEVRAYLTVAADGRTSVIRDRLGSAAADVRRPDGRPVVPAVPAARPTPTASTCESGPDGCCSASTVTSTGRSPDVIAKDSFDAVRSAGLDGVPRSAIARAGRRSWPTGYSRSPVGTT